MRPFTHSIMRSKTSIVKRGTVIGALTGICVSAALFWQMLHSQDIEGLIYITVLLGLPANFVFGGFLHLLSLSWVGSETAMIIIAQQFAMFLGIPLTFGGFGGLVGYAYYVSKRRKAAKN